ncbi:MAG TPA: type II CRISPR RNA-guided endonuclease Cas9, partial [Ruminococcus bicirculans (ex Wegman et al. 2014)]|nr:type II CRISPR RNA-guided endonuclease Cas9 [Ruminococcus bicirculans (ex Wegman et al. 2014)]
MNRQYYALPENHKSMSERLKDMYVPTAVRRAVTRTFDIVKELKKIQGRDPDKIFIEMARGTGETPKGKRTNSRKDQILEHWHGLDNKDINDLKKSGIWEHLDTIDDAKLRSDKYFLYFMQLGRCMYTEKPIPFEEVENEHKWNIDHIWPQAKIKDDSLDNKVLVSSNENGKKSDSYPISDDIRHSMAGLWHSLYKKGLISEKKYQRLTRSTPFTDDELSGFIARQLVETRQSTKAVATLLKEQFPNTEIDYVKAGLVSDFRQEMGMLKCREVNDLHHAKDAYLNIVLGNVYNTRFTKDPLNFVKNNEKYSIKIFQKNSDGKKTGVMTRKVERGGEVAWDPETSFAIVRKMMSKNSIRYVRYAYMRKSGQNGGFFDQNPLRKGKGMVSI